MLPYEWYYFLTNVPNQGAIYSFRACTPDFRDFRSDFRDFKDFGPYFRDFSNFKDFRDLKNINGFGPDFKEYLGRVSGI